MPMWIRKNPSTPIADSSCALPRVSSSVKNDGGEKSTDLSDSTVSSGTDATIDKTDAWEVQTACSDSSQPTQVQILDPKIRKFGRIRSGSDMKFRSWFPAQQLRSAKSLLRRQSSQFSKSQRIFLTRKRDGEETKESDDLYPAVTMQHFKVDLLNDSEIETSFVDLSHEEKADADVSADDQEQPLVDLQNDCQGTTKEDCKEELPGVVTLKRITVQIQSASPQGDVYGNLAARTQSSPALNGSRQQSLQKVNKRRARTFVCDMKNRKTGLASLSLPTEGPRLEKPNLLAGENLATDEENVTTRKMRVWKSAVDAGTGRTYFYHRSSLETTWDTPRDIDLWIEVTEDKMTYEDCRELLKSTNSPTSGEDEDHHISLQKIQRQGHLVLSRIESLDCDLSIISNSEDWNIAEEIFSRYEIMEEQVLEFLDDLVSSTSFDEPEREGHQNCLVP